MTSPLVEQAVQRRRPRRAVVTATRSRMSSKCTIVGRRRGAWPRTAPRRPRRAASSALGPGRSALTPTLAARPASRSAAARRRATRARPRRRCGGARARTRRRRRDRRASPARPSRSTAATRRSSASPCGWPWRSLRNLKSSRSTTTSAQRVAVARGRHDGAREVVLERALVGQVGEPVAARAVQRDAGGCGRARARRRGRTRAPRRTGRRRTSSMTVRRTSCSWLSRRLWSQRDLEGVAAVRQLDRHDELEVAVVLAGVRLAPRVAAGAAQGGGDGRGRPRGVPASRRCRPPR